MKKTFKSILIATLGIFAFTCCEDVPAPYQIPGTGNQQSETTSTFYSSTSCSDWSMLAATSGNNPWSQGSSYTQATGYQKWDGASSKTNRMADGYLISPGFSTTTDSTAAYISFQYCVGYANNDAQFSDHIKLYASTQYAPADGFVTEKWTQLDWKATHTSSNWELATTTVTLPAEFLNQEKVNIAFYFTTPNDTKSSTFEVANLKVVAGKPASSNGEGGGGQTEEGTPVTCAEAVELVNALADGATSTETYTITGYITEVIGSVNKNQQSFWMADEKDGGKVFEAYWANLPEGVTEFVKGSKVKITGQLIKYVNKTSGAVTPEIKNATVVILEAADGGGGGQTEEGTPVTCAQAAELTNALNDGATSTETYTVTGYITEVIGKVDKSQQSFWMADTKEGGHVFEAYWANLPEGVTAFTVGSKVKITGKLMKYVNKTSGDVTPEIKNATVVILEVGDGGDNGGGGNNDTGDTSEYGISLSYTKGTNFYEQTANINGVEECTILKIGTSKAPGDFTLTVPAGKHSFYAVTWKGGNPADVVLKNGEDVIKTVTVQPNDGATGNPTYTLTVTEADKYEFEVASDCTVTVSSDKRVLFFGIK